MTSAPTPVKDHSAPVDVDVTITRLAAVLTVILTAVAFWLSYEHLQEIAGRHGLADGTARSWAWPATVDLFIVIGELLILRASLKQHVDWWAVGLATTGSLGSIALNVTGVGAGAEIFDYVVAAVPPIAALLAFGALMRQVHAHLANRAAGTGLTPVEARLTPVNVTVDRIPGIPAAEPVDEVVERPLLPLVEARVNPPSTAVHLCTPMIYNNRNDQIIRSLYGVSFARPGTKEMVEQLAAAGVGGSESTARTARGRVENAEPYLAQFATAIAA